MKYASMSPVSSVACSSFVILESYGLGVRVVRRVLTFLSGGRASSPRREGINHTVIITICIWVIYGVARGRAWEVRM
jgi:hypothetical protein